MAHGRPDPAPEVRGIRPGWRGCRWT